MEVKEMVDILRENYPQYVIDVEDCDRMEEDTHISWEIKMTKGSGDSLTGAKIGITEGLTDCPKGDAILAAGRVVDEAVLLKEAEKKKEFRR